MVFERLRNALDAGGASVDAVLDRSDVLPGGVVAGQVHLSGGHAPVEVRGVTVSIVARAEVEGGDAEWSTGVALAGQQVAGGFTLQAGARHSMPFRVPVPWETPVTSYRGWHLRGMDIGVRTDVDVAGAVDRSDVDPLAVTPLPAQERIMAALDRLGFRFVHADVEVGRIRGAALPLFQEIEFLPSPQFARGISHLEVTFLARPTDMDVILEADRRGGLLTEGYDAYARFTVPQAGFEGTDWEGVLGDQIGRLAARRGWL